MINSQQHGDRVNVTVRNASHSSSCLNNVLKCFFSSLNMKVNGLTGLTLTTGL